MLQYDETEIKLFNRLDSPQKIQDYLNTLEFNFENGGATCQSPRFVIKSKKAHCMEGAMLAAAVLEFHGHKPLLVDLRADKRDYDHVIAVFKQFGCWGAVGKTNHAVLRYREPVYRTIRELVVSFFHEYFDNQGRKNLREYSLPLNLNHFSSFCWQASADVLWDIPYELDKAKHYPILSKQQIRNLRRADRIEIEAGKLVEWKNKKNGGSP